MTADFDPGAFLLECPLVPIVIARDADAVVFIGPQAAAHLGYSRDEWAAPGFWQRAILVDDQRTVAESRAGLGPGDGHDIEYRMEHRDGRIVWTGETLRAVDRPGHGVILQGFLRDITDRKGLELHLWRTEERLRAMLQSAPDALVLTGQDGVILDMNDQAVALFGYERADIIGSALDHLLPVRLRDRLADLRRAFEHSPERKSLLDGHALTIERSDGLEVPVEMSMSLVPGPGGGRHILCSVHDLTVRRRVEVNTRPPA